MGKRLHVYTLTNIPCVVINTALSAQGRSHNNNNPSVLIFGGLIFPNPRFVDSSIVFPLHPPVLHMLFLFFSLSLFCRMRNL